MDPVERTTAAPRVMLVRRAPASVRPFPSAATARSPRLVCRTPKWKPCAWSQPAAMRGSGLCPRSRPPRPTPSAEAVGQGDDGGNDGRVLLVGGRALDEDGRSTRRRRAAGAGTRATNRAGAEVVDGHVDSEHAQAEQPSIDASRSSKRAVSVTSRHSDEGPSAVSPSSTAVVPSAGRLLVPARPVLRCKYCQASAAVSVRQRGDVERDLKHHTAT